MALRGWEVAIPDGISSARNTTLGQWLREQRYAHGLTQEELAGRAGCSRETIRELEANTRRPSRHLAATLAQSLGVPSNEHQTFIQSARGQMSVLAPNTSRTPGLLPLL
jgi:putative transcriptional regulator